MSPYYAMASSSLKVQNPKIDYFCTPRELHKADLKAVEYLSMCEARLDVEKSRAYKLQVEAEQDNGALKFIGGIFVGALAGWAAHDAFK